MRLDRVMASAAGTTPTKPPLASYSCTPSKTKMLASNGPMAARNSCHLTFLEDQPQRNEVTPLLPLALPSSTPSPAIYPREQRAFSDTLRLPETRPRRHTSITVLLEDLKRTELFMMIQLTGPMIVYSLLEMAPDSSVGMMVGHASKVDSTRDLAAFNLALVFQIIGIMSPINGVGAVMDTFCCQTLGASHFYEMWLYCQAGLMLLFGGFLVPLLVFLAHAQKILWWLDQEAEVAGPCGTYVAILACGLPFSMMFAVLKSILQAQHAVGSITVADLVGAVVLVTSAYAFTFHTSMGFYGCALASPLSALAKTVVLIPVSIRSQVFQRHWPGWRFREALELVPKIYKLALSGFLMVLFQMAGFCSISLLAGILPKATDEISANGIFASLLIFVIMPLQGVSIAGATRIGNALGAYECLRASVASRYLLGFSFATALVTMGGMLLFGNTYARLFTSDPATLAFTACVIRNMWPLVLCFGFVYGLQGILRACGRQFLCAQFNFACLFVVGVPVGLVFAMHFKMGLLGLWYGNLVGHIVYAGGGMLWLWRLDWSEMAHEVCMARHSDFDERHVHGEPPTDGTSLLPTTSAGRETKGKGTIWPIACFQQCTNSRVA